MDALNLGDVGPKLAKGTILVVGANNQIYGLPVGTNGQTLKANSSASNGLGVEWGADA